MDIPISDSNGNRTRWGKTTNQLIMSANLWLRPDPNDTQKRFKPNSIERVVN